MASKLTPELIGALSTATVGIGSLALSYIKWILPWIRRNREEADKQQLIDGLSRLRIAFVTMESLLQIPGVGRVILFAAHNSGGVPKIGSPFYTSAIHWAVSTAPKESLADYRMIPLDGHYTKLLHELQEQDSKVIVTTDLPPCILKDYYEAEQVSSALLVFVGIREARFLYVSISKFKGALFEKPEITRIIRRVRQIRMALLSDNISTVEIDSTDSDLHAENHEN